jgi:hypothetical protein
MLAGSFLWLYFVNAVSARVTIQDHPWEKMFGLNRVKGLKDELWMLLGVSAAEKHVRVRIQAN